MDGAKAEALDAFAAGRGLGMVRFDYSGTGSSDGDFEAGTLSGWLDEALLVIDQLASGPLVLIGSSMGGWIALHAAARRPERVKALVGIAAAPDFTEWGYEPSQKAALATGQTLRRDSPYGGEPQITTAGFWHSGQALRLLDAPIEIDCRIRLVHGEADTEVPIEIGLRLMRQLRSGDVQLTILKGGGHRLSEPHEIATILAVVAQALEP